MIDLGLFQASTIDWAGEGRRSQQSIEAFLRMRVVSSCKRNASSVSADLLVRSLRNWYRVRSEEQCGMAKITVALVEDHALVRQAFRRLLEDSPFIRVVGEGSTGLDAVELVRQRDFARHGHAGVEWT